MSTLTKFALVLISATAGIGLLASADVASRTRAVEPVRYVGNDKPIVVDEMLPIEFAYEPDEFQPAAARVNTAQNSSAGCDGAPESLPQTPASFFGNAQAKPAFDQKLIPVPVI